MSITKFNLKQIFYTNKIKLIKSEHQHQLKIPIMENLIRKQLDIIHKSNRISLEALTLFK